MQPNANRPVYIVQPTNITHLNVRPTVIATGGQSLQQQQPVYQISTVRQPTMPQQQSLLYQVQTQPRVVTSSPVYAPLQQQQQPQRFVSSPQQILTNNTSSTSPRLISAQTLPQMQILTAPSATATSVVVQRPSLVKVATPPMTTAVPSPQPPPAPGTKEFAVKVPKTRSRYGIMEFATGISIDLNEWKSAEMKREINPFTYRAPTNLDPVASSTATTITTSLGVVLPKFGAGSEYGREEKESLKRKRYATKGTNIEDLPWLLTERSSSDKKPRHYRGLKKGGVATNSSYYVFIQGTEGFEAYPVDEWFGFTPTNVYKTLDFDEAEKQYEDRHKNLSKWFLKHQVVKEKEDEEENEDGERIEKGTKSGIRGKNKSDFKLLDVEDWVHENDEEDDDGERDEDDGGEKGSKKMKNSNKKNNKKSTSGGGTNLSDDDDDDRTNQKAATSNKKQKKKKSGGNEANEEHGEDSDDGDHECEEIDYTSDETSDEEDDIKDIGTVKASMKYEVKDIDEGMRSMPNIEKILENMEENGDEFDMESDDEEVVEEDENDEEANKPLGAAGGDDLSEVGKEMHKLFKSDALSKEIDSSSDDDDLDDSDDPDKEPMDSITNSMNSQPITSEQVKTEKGHKKKAREEEMRAIKSTVMSLPTTSSSNPSETITEEKVRNLILHKHMTFGELIQKFLPKMDQARTKEVKDGIVQKLATILKKLNIEERMINGKKRIKLKS